MSATPQVIDDSAMVPPHIRLVHQILADALRRGYEMVELVRPVGEMPVLRAQIDGAWQSLMAFPLPVFDSMIAHLKAMAAVAPGSQEGNGTIEVRMAAVEASIVLSVRRNDQGLEELTLHFRRSGTANGL